MADLLTHFKPGEIIGLVAVAGGLLIALSRRSWAGSGTSYDSPH